jgi:hypothetical protein
MSTASPETTSATSAPKQTALMKRLARMREHKDFEAAQAHIPPTEEVLEQASRDSRRGGVMLAIGLLLGANALRHSALLWQLFWGAIGATFVVLGARRFARGKAASGEYIKNPLRRVPALVADRRSQTDLDWMGGRTTYHFQLEFDDGTNGEFKYPGRGTQDELLVKGNTGLAYLRGDTLIAWKHIKV